MKSIFSLLAILSLLPLVANARVRSFTPEKPLIPVTIPNKSAYPAPAIVPKAKNWNATWLAVTKEVSSRDAIQAINRSQPKNETDTNFLATILKNLPPISAKLQQKQFSAKEAKETNDALVAAATQAIKENWPTEAKNNVVEFSKALALKPTANKEMLETVRENCRL